jgi:HD-GYP domain-containing protein (c-di-GMP phosphodiesterase class II)
MLHDIGKLSIDTEILCKEGALDEAEKAQIRLHPEAGHRSLASQPNVPPVALNVCLQHHERLDGTGYPFGLSGDQVTTAARIATICDMYDAMTSNRPYRKGMSPIEAITEMETLPGAIDRELLFKFMRGMGVFPVGNLIRLRSNRLALVMPTTSANSLPAARVFYNVPEGHLADYEDVVLTSGFAGDRAICPAEPPAELSGNWPEAKKCILAGLPLERRRPTPR